MNWQPLANDILQALSPVIAAGIVALIGFIIKYFVEKIRSSNNATILMLAGVAVRYAETQLGPDTGTGLAKQNAAVDFLCKQIKGLDRAVATNFVKAAYHAVFQDIAPLSPGKATSSTPPSA